MASGQVPCLQAEHMTAPSSLVQPEKDLAARAVPHMSQSQYCRPNDTKARLANSAPVVSGMTTSVKSRSGTSPSSIFLIASLAPAASTTV